MIEKQNTLPFDFSSKTVPCNVELPDLKDRLRKYFLQTNSVYERIFSIVKNEREYYSKPEPLRHPLIFYFGHTSCFFINKLLDKGLITKRVNENYERIFAVGVDEMDWDDLDETHYDWPTVAEVQQYRDRVREVVLEVISKSTETHITWNSDMWVVLMGIEHERIHLETSSVIIRRMAAEELEHPKWFKECPHVETNRNKVPENALRAVQGVNKKWNRQRETSETYGWDNEYGNKLIDVKDFSASEMLVSNAEFMKFMEDGGYSRAEFWSEEGKNWLKSKKVTHPVFWVRDDENIEEPKYRLKTMTRVIDMPWDWPAEVNNLEAEAFCEWKSRKTGKRLRLPTEDEYFALRESLPEDLMNWKWQSVGNINLELWISPSPVNMFKRGDFYDVVGNVWQHTVTPIHPFDGFKIHPVYEDFTTPTFDGRHNIIKGGSFISTGNEALYHSRYAFRRHFYQFAGFRYVHSSNPETSHVFEIDQSDVSVERALRTHFVEEDSYINRVVSWVGKSSHKLPNTKSLVIGCSVGRLPLELSKYFAESYGTDYTARYFQMATRMIEKQCISYRGLEVCLGDMQLNKAALEKIHLYQMNAENLDKNKINGIELVVVDGLSIRPHTIAQVLRESLNLVSKQNSVFYLVVGSDKVNSVAAIQGVFDEQDREWSTVEEFQSFGHFNSEDVASCRLIRLHSN